MNDLELMEEVGAEKAVDFLKRLNEADGWMQVDSGTEDGKILGWLGINFPELLDISGESASFPNWLVRITFEGRAWLARNGDAVETEPRCVSEGCEPDVYGIECKHCGAEMQD